MTATENPASAADHLPLELRELLDELPGWSLSQHKGSWAILKMPGESAGWVSVDLSKRIWCPGARTHVHSHDSALAGQWLGVPTKAFKGRGWLERLALCLRDAADNARER